MQNLRNIVFDIDCLVQAYLKQLSALYLKAKRFDVILQSTAHSSFTGSGGDQNNAFINV